MIDACFMTTPEWDTLRDQGHDVQAYDFKDYDIIISPKAQMTPLSRLGYVVKKLKDIVKDVAK